MHIDRRSNVSGQKFHAKGSRKEAKIQEFMYRDTTNVEHEMYDHTRIIGATGIATKGLRKTMKP